MNKQARNWVPALVLLVMIVFGFWFVSRQMTRDYSYTEQAFQQDIEERCLRYISALTERYLPDR